MRLRLGVPTASQFDRLITPKGLKVSSQAPRYATDLLIEWLTGEPIEAFTNDWTNRGTAMEPEARLWYELETGRAVEQVGFVTRDDGLVGCSPDGLVNPDGLIEIKCHAPHVRPPEHKGQCQGLLYVTEREWCDLVLYHPAASEIRRVTRDDRYLKALVPVLDTFVRHLEAEKIRLARAKRQA